MPEGLYNKIKSDNRKEQKMEWEKKYIAEEEERQKALLEQLKIGGTEEFNKRIMLFPLHLIPSPVRIPCWMFRKYQHNPDFELDDIEKVAMAHVIHFTNCNNPTGYMECSGNIENWCKCSVEEAHNALKRLEKRNLIKSHVLEPEYCYGHKRNLGYFVNVPYVHTILNLYKMDIWT